jgi:hypothetical protein
MYFFIIIRIYVSKSFVIFSIGGADSVSLIYTNVSAGQFLVLTGKSVLGLLF